MARVALHITDMANRYTIKGLLERSGHVVTDSEPQIAIADTPDQAVALLDRGPVLVLATVTTLGAAVAAMERGVFGYVFVPLQPGEVTLMVERALQGQASGPPSARTEGTTPPQTLQEVEGTHILTVLRQCKNNQAKAAKVLGIGRNTLWRKLKKIEAAHHES